MIVERSSCLSPVRRILESCIRVMRSLADVAEVEADEFVAAHVSYHFMWRRVLR